MASIFEVEPNPDDPYDGIDLRYGLGDMSNGKVDAFFRDMANERGVSGQQSYARIASTLLFPHQVSAYCEHLVFELHLRQSRRGSQAWKLAEAEIDDCLEYLDIISDTEYCAAPVLVEDNTSQSIEWDMQYLGKYHRLAPFFYTKVEAYKYFCSDPFAIRDLNVHLALHRQNKESSVE